MVTRYSGMFLIVGVILTIVSSLLHPGIALINPVDQTDFQAAVGAMGDAPTLSHLMTILNILGMMLTSFGVLALFPLATNQGGLSGTFLKFGILVSIVEWSSIVVGLGMRHYVVYLAQQAAAAPPDPSYRRPCSKPPSWFTQACPRFSWCSLRSSPLPRSSSVPV